MARETGFSECLVGTSLGGTTQSMAGTWVMNIFVHILFNYGSGVLAVYLLAARA